MKGGWARQGPPEGQEGALRHLDRATPHLAPFKPFYPPLFFEGEGEGEGARA